MKHLIKTGFIIWILALSLAPIVHADPNHPQMPPDNSSAELKRMKSLVGRWTTTSSMFGKPNEQLFVEYSITAGGSAVLERIFPGTPQEMISVYYDDNDGKLAMTHYCIMRNRPTLKLIQSKKNEFILDVVKVDGVQSQEDPSMGAITIRFKDKNNLSTTCKSRGKGNEKHEPMTIEYKRVL